MANMMYLACIVLVFCVATSLQMPSSNPSLRLKRAPADEEAATDSGPEMTTKAPDSGSGGSSGFPTPDTIKKFFEFFEKTPNFFKETPFYNMYEDIAKKGIADRSAIPV